MNRIEWAKREIELVKKNEDKYGKMIYDDVLELYSALIPILEKQGHSGFSYGTTIAKLDRLLDGKVLTPITDEDFFSEKQHIKENPKYLKDRGLKSNLQCPRYSSLFREETLDGKVSYIDVSRVSIIDQHNLSWHSGWTEKICKDYIPKITMPYIPTDTPIYIYVWDFTYNNTLNNPFCVESGVSNAIYIDKIVFPNGDVIKVNKCFIEDGIELKLTDEMFKELKMLLKKV